ncbi:YcnI family copper-binding membrane protein [Streptomyces xantholiticus]|uniref:YcnI family copper-binding membrane protein n=1 Tax=Streptomyces xantholiticus TaxID=68285 RepID=UPI0016781F3F|nr:YcnI family protein [Streptomyces xantholiticus]GGW45384.1 membrane protein [Streptomyces xantholiticus]
MNVSRIAAASAVAAASMLLFCGAASAHVGVQPQGEAAKGGYAVVNVKVPNERDNASTVRVEINMPAEHPLSSVMPQAVPGWKVKVDKSELDKPLEVHGKQITEAVTKVTWTADGTKIGPGEFQQFPLSLGRLPEDADQLVFKAIQTYDNKEVVRWIEEPKEGGEEPESPAPVLKLSAAADDHHGATATGAKDDANAAGHEDEAASRAASGDGSDSTARILGAVGILVGAAGVVFGVLAGRRRSA